LFRELELARADGSYPRKLRALGQVDVLIVDDWAMAPMADTERRAFLAICDERYLTRSTLLTSQLPVAKCRQHSKGHPAAFRTKPPRSRSSAAWRTNKMLPAAIWTF
jgi:DNA replication protein DnaC